MAKLSASGMNGRRAGNEKVRKLTLAALLTAVVVVLALLGTAIRFGTFNINLALVPIVIGAAMLGVWYGAWFGFVNAMVILLSGDAAPFLTVNVFGTIVTVIAKGVLAGLVSGAIYQLLQRYNKYAAVVAAALVCPVVNTGVFLIGCRLFFWDTISEWAIASGKSSAMAYVLAFFIGGNFLVELAINVILAPVIARLLGFSQDNDTAMIVYGVVLAAVGLGFLVFAIVLMKNASFAATQSSIEDAVKAALEAEPETASELGQTAGIVAYESGSALSIRYLVMAIFANLVLIGGSVLIGIGSARKSLLTKK